jgi:hypothetical protein
VTERAHEVALTPDEVQEILAHRGPHALLVGVQALALLAAVYEVTPPKALAAAISSDADFIGNADLARRLGRALKQWDLWLAVRIANRFLSRLIIDGADTRVIFDAIERIGQIATNKRLTGVMLDYEVDVLGRCSHRAD